MLALTLFIWLAITSRVDASTCSAAPKGWYDSNGVFTAGVPPSSALYSFVLKPSFLSCEELESLNRRCVAKINGFRSGQIPFTGGIVDKNRGNPQPLLAATSNAACHAATELGDFSYRTASCTGFGKVNSYLCGALTANQARTITCPQDIEPTFASVVSRMEAVLQSLWDQGSPNHSGVTTTYATLKSTAYSYVSCGFAFGKTTAGTDVILMSHHFASEFSGEVGTAEPTKQPTTRQPTVSTLTPTAQPTTPRPTAPAVCGNGIVEQGEECDCGSQCNKDTCCNAKTCKFNAGASCSALDVCCNPNTCSVRGKTFVCRAKDGECDVAETCDGTSTKCPADTLKRAGTSCSSGTGTCSPCGLCAPTMNTMCKNINKDWYQSCNLFPQSTMCSKLWCNKRGDDQCWSNSGVFFPVAGTKCGENMYCSPTSGECLKEEDYVCPTIAPTKLPTMKPTKAPVEVVFTPTTAGIETFTPTKRPSSLAPTNKQTSEPTKRPTTLSPATQPFTEAPSFPTLVPTKRPTTLKPTTKQPTPKPSKRPTVAPTKKQTSEPTKRPSTLAPGTQPVVEAPTLPTVAPTKRPTTLKPTTKQPTPKPSKKPTLKPTLKPSKVPTKKPIKAPTRVPTPKPTKAPTKKPTKPPTRAPTPKPSKIPTKKPTLKPTKAPTKKPSKAPTRAPTKKPVVAG